MNSSLLPAFECVWGGDRSLFEAKRHIPSKDVIPSPHHPSCCCSYCKWQGYRFCWFVDWSTWFDHLSASNDIEWKRGSGITRKVRFVVLFHCLKSSYSFDLRVVVKESWFFNFRAKHSLHFLFNIEFGLLDRLGSFIHSLMECLNTSCSYREFAGLSYLASRELG